MALGVGDERVQSLAQRAEPEAVVDHLGPLLGDDVLEAGDVLRERDVLQRLVGLEQEHGRRRLVDLA